MIPRFDVDGRLLAVGHGERVQVCDATGAAVWDAQVPGLLDFAIVHHELWAVTATTLHRWQLADGAPIATRAVALDPGGRLDVSSTLPTLAVWRGATSWVLRAEAEPVRVADAEFTLPLAEGQWIAWHHHIARLRRVNTEGWRVPLGDPGAIVVGGQVVLDGRLVALVHQRPQGELAVCVLSTRDGSRHTTVRLPAGADIRFAARRGYVVARIRDEHGAGGRLVVLDLRFGRLVRELALPATAVELAVDDALQCVALVDADGGVTVVEPDDLMPTAVPVVAAAAPVPHERVREHEPVVRAAAVVAAAVVAADAAAELDALPDEPLVQLDPVVALPAAPAEARERALAGRLALIAARAELAIARAWDSGRLVRSDPQAPPFADEVAGLLGRTSGRAAEQVAAAGDAVDAAAAALSTDDAARGDAATALDVLARDYRLSPLAGWILVTAAAPQLRGTFARLYGILANDPGRALVDELLITEVLDGVASPAEIARELDADQPLRRYGLLALAPGLRPFAGLTVDELVVRALADQPIAGVRDPYLVVRAADRSLEELAVPRRVLADALRYLARPAEQPARLAVRGRSGSGRHAVLAALVARAGRELGVIELSSLPGPPADLPLHLARLLRRAMLRGLLPCIDGLESVAAAAESELPRQIAHVLREHPGPIAVRLRADASVPLDPGYLLIELPARSEQQRVASWVEALASREIAGVDAGELAARYRVGPGVIERVAREVARSVEAGAPPAQWAAALDAGVRQYLDNRLGQTATRVTRLATWADIVLPDDILDSVLELTARVRHRKQVFETWGFDRSLTTARGITALFAGGPGTGKTMVAGVIARDLGLELYRVDVSRISSKWIGETEKNLGNLFDAAEDGQVMLLFDEADSLFAKRTEVKSSVDRYANMEVNYLLQRLDSFEGVAILTTNQAGAIDPAFRRRLSSRLTFPFPDDDMRERLWKALLPADAPTAPGIDFAWLSRKFKLSGGYIRNALLRAAFLAAEDASPLTQDHIERAIRMEYREIGKLADSGVLE